jgi:signal transduction histidine kinase
MKQGRADFLPVCAALAAGLVLSAFVFLVVRGYYRSLDQQQFQRNATYYSTAFKSDIERHVASLAAIHAFVSATHGVNRWEFSAFAHQILPQNSGFKAVLWVPRVDQKARKDFEGQFQRDGLYGLHIRELDGNGALVNAPVQPGYLPVAYIEPFEGNGSLVGLDLSSDPVYAHLFRDARQSGKAAASPPVTRALVEGARSPIVLVAFPLNLSGARHGVVSGAQGYALGVLQLSRVVQDAIGSRAAPIQAAIAYGTGENPQVFGSGGRTLGLDHWFGDAPFHRALPFDIAGQHFVLAVRSASRDDSATRLYAPPIAALLVLALTALLAQSMLTTTLRKRMVERAVVARTAELREVNKTLRAEVEQRRQAEASLRIAKDKAESADRAKSAFLATMSHELRTPLNAIIGFSSVLADKAVDARWKDYLGEINGNGHKLLGLINDILDITQIDGGETDATDLIHLSDIAETVIDNLQPLAQVSGISLKSAMSDHLPLVRGDAKRLQKAMTHLLSNAIKFTAKGGWAKISLYRRGPGLVIEVSDNGAGMPPGAEARILELFSQFDGTLARNHEGIGLGLTLVRRVADLHGAALEISSRLGEGTQVGFALPAHRLVTAKEVA